jgi:hypothetical protein
MGEYNDYPNIQKASIKQRVQIIKYIAFDSLNNGKMSVEDIEKAMKQFNDSEQYEGSQACLLALSEWKLKHKNK